MKKILLVTTLLFSMQAFSMEIHNPDGSTSYVTKDPSGAISIQNPDGSRNYITKDPSGAVVINNADGSNSYITDNGF